MGKKKPAQVVIDLFGIRPLARLLGRSPGAVHKWKEKGLVPAKYHERLLDLAREKKLRLTAEMLICGV